MKSDHEPIQPEVVAEMAALGQVIHEVTPDGWGFMLLMFKCGKGDGHRMNYLCDVNKDDMMAALEELLANMKADKAEGH